MLQRLQTEIAHRGFYSFKVNATDFLDPYDPSVRSKPELYEVAMNSQLSSQLSDSTVATIGGRASPYLLPPKPPVHTVSRGPLSGHTLFLCPVRQQRRIQSIALFWQLHFSAVTVATNWR